MSQAEAQARLERYGRNELTSEKPVPAWRKLLAQFQDVLVILLLIATLISSGLWLYERDSALPYEAIAIFAVVLLNAILGHVQQSPKTPNGCEECLKIGDRWVHLRLCQTCGHVGCCDESKNKHATKHFHSTNHPIMKSFEAGEDWGWCYVDELFFESFPGSFTTQWCGVLGATP